MTKRNIELELRAEVDSKEYSKLLKNLKKNAKFISYTERLSVMYFGKIENNKFDIRIRVTNGKAEVAVKKGSLHAEDRVELTQQINKNQFMGMVGIYNLFNFDCEVAERKTYNFYLGNKVTFSLVSAGEISYVEIEKMSTKEEVEKNRNELIKIIDSYGLKLISSERQFHELCNRLSESYDWKFKGTDENNKKLKKLLKKYFKSS